MRLGGKNCIPVDFRVITASKQRFNAIGLRKKYFREDLYYRLSVLKMSLPPLRERKADIPILASYSSNLYCSKMNIAVRK
jgi:transcriptional regulator with PAS, ATPase and Fis domain